MFKSEKYKLVMSMALTILFIISGIETKAADSDVLDIIIVGVELSEGLIDNISFDYTIDYNVSEEWRNKQLELTRKKMSNEYPEEMELRVSTLEHTLRTGSSVFEGNKFNIVSKTIALSDREIFQDEVVTCDGVKLTELNLKERTGYISNDLKTRSSDLIFDPRNFPLLFVDGQSMYSALTSENITANVLGTEKIDGTTCYIIEIVKSFSTPKGIQKQVKRRCWIAPDKGYLVKKGISYGVKSPDKPLSITESELVEVVDGIWYYSKVTFQSYPLLSTTPDVTAVLELKNIAVNQQLEDNAFAPDITKVEEIYDAVLNFSYPTESISP